MPSGKILRGGTTAFSNDKNILPDTLREGTSIPITELEQLHAQMQDMQLEIDFKRNNQRIKKDPASTRPP